MNKPVTGIDPSTATQWEPLSRVVTNIATLNFVEVSPARLESRRADADLVLTVFMSAAVIAPIAFLPTMVTGELQATAAAIIAAVAAALVALRMWYGTPPHVFDRASGHYWRGRGTATAPDARNACRLASILAIQLLFKRSHRKQFYGARRGSRIAGYEINLVLHGGTRVHVADHGHLPSLRGEAAKLARFLNCKVWDGAGNWPAESDPRFVRVGEEAAQRPPVKLWQQAVLALMGLLLAVVMAAVFFGTMRALHPDPPEQVFPVRPGARPPKVRTAPPDPVVAQPAPAIVVEGVEEPVQPIRPATAPVLILSMDLPVRVGGQLVLNGENFSAPANHEVYVQRNGVKIALGVLRTLPNVLWARVPTDPRLSPQGTWHLIVVTKQPAFTSDPYPFEFEDLGAAR